MNEKLHSPGMDPAVRRDALASPFRLELISQFGQDDELSVSDLATRTGRPATSLYHHIRVLEDAGIIKPVGTRPKGKRSEVVYSMAETMMGIAHEPDDPTSKKKIEQTVRAAFRSAARDLVAALDREDIAAVGPHRNTFSLILSSRVSRDLLAEINDRLRSLEELIAEAGENDPGPSPDDQFVSLTIALAPIRGRRAGPTPKKGEAS